MYRVTPRLGFRPLGALFPVLAAVVGSLCALSAPAAPVPAAASLRAAPVAPPETHPLGSLDRLLDERRQRFHEAVRQRDPAAVVPLLGLSGLWAGVEDRPALAAFAAEAAKQGAAVSPLVMAQGLAVLREVTVHQGDLDGAARLLDALGIVPTYAVLGPFDNEGRKGHQAVYAPESEAESPDAAQVYPGKNPRLSLRWQEIPRGDLSLDGTLHFSAWLTPETQGTAYAVVYVQSQVRQPIALRVGSSGPVKVWVNRGQPPAVSSDAYHAPHMDQTVGSAMLETGWNRLLIKVSAVEKPWSLLLRLTRPAGEHIDGLVFRATPPKPRWSLPLATRYAGPPPANLLTALRARVPKAGAPAVRAAALLDLGVFLHHVQPGDPDAREAETTLEAAYNLAPSLRALSLRVLATGDANRKRQIIESGLAQLAAPLGAGKGRSARAQAPLDDQVGRRGLLTCELARLLEEGQRHRQAQESFEKAEALLPASYLPRLGIAQLQVGRGLLASAESMLADEVRRTQAPALRVLHQYAELLVRGGHAPQADAVYQRILAASKDDLEALRALLSQAHARGDHVAVRSLLAQASALQPRALWIFREHVDLLDAEDRPADALQLIDQRMSQVAADADWHERRARLLQRLDRPQEALQAFRRALELKPQNPELRKYMAQIDPQAKSGEDLVRTFRVDVAELLKRPREKQAAGDAARVLFDQQVTRVHENGLSEVYAQRVVEILDERGGREYDGYSIRYTPDTQSVEVRAAKVYKQSGEVQEASLQDDGNVSEPWYGLYYDVHAQSVRFAGLQPGDVVSIEYVLADVGRRNLLSDYFGDTHVFQEEIPRAETRYTLVLPEDLLKRKPLYFNQPSGVGTHVVRSDRQLGPDHVIEFRAVAVPRILGEVGMPGATEILPYLHVSTYRTWEEVATWYRGLIAEQLQPSDEITRAARDAVAQIPAADEPARVRAIYNLVLKKTRYVGLEFGIHGYKPYKVTQVFERKFGDCKDKAALLHVMLKEIGIQSSMVLARTRRGGAIASEPASLSVFDHAIVYVPSLDLYLDGTAEFSGSSELPTDDQDIMVLIVADPRPPWNGQGHLARTPVLPAAHSTVTRQLQVELQPNGGATVVERHEVRGQSASRWRAHFQSQGEQSEKYEKQWNETYPGAKVKRVALSNLLDLERPVLLQGEVNVPNWGRSSGGNGQDLTLRMLGKDADLLRSYARLSQRKMDLILGFPWTNLDEVTLRVPPGLTLRRLPEARTLRSPFGTYDLTVTPSADGRSLTVRSVLTVERHRISQQDYPAFRQFCVAVDAAMSQDLVVTHSDGGPR